MKDFFNRVYNTLEELWEYYKDMYAVGIVKQEETAELTFYGRRPYPPTG